MSITFNGNAEHARAIDWASDGLEVTQLELISDSSWAATYRLYGAAQTRYLKILPGAARQRVTRLVEVSKQLRGQVPAVLRAASEEGWVLFAELDGQKLSRDTDVEEMIAVARDFGAIQAKASRSARFLARLESVDLAPIKAALLDFLAGPPTPAGKLPVQTSAADFIGTEQAARFLRLLQSRLPLLDPHMAAAADLPVTLCHGDLHAQNVVHRADGKTVFFDWDDASAGPAGLCLHGIFGGCTLPAILAQMTQTHGSAGETPEGRRLDAYVNALVRGRYAPRAKVLKGLLGTMAAGQMRFITSFGGFASDKDRDAAAETINDRLNDLLDLCDWLAAKQPAAAHASADDYERYGEWQRAYRLVQDLLAREPANWPLLRRYSDLCYRVGDFDSAEEAAREAYAAAPGDVDTQLTMAQAHLGRLDETAGGALLAGVLAQQPQHPRALALQSRFKNAAAIREQASKPENLPRLALSAAERDQGRLEPDTLALMVDLFKTHGAVQVDNLFSPEYIARLQGAFAAKYGEHFHDGEHPNALKVGDKRYMLTMELDETFGAEELVASNLVLPFMKGIMGKECILSAYTAVISLPGSDAQELHKDHSELFDEEGWHLKHPTFAAQIVVPLLTLDELTGATRVFKGTQRTPLNRSGNGPHQDPVVPLGSGFFLDYSVAHYGMGNRSQQVRPILNLVYSRPWFRDCRNYHVQPPLRFSNHYFEAASDTTKKLVHWWALERKAAGQ